MSLFLVASDAKCIEVEAPDLTLALEQGMGLLKQNPKWGNVGGCPKPSSLEEFKELRNKLDFSRGDFKSEQILAYVESYLELNDVIGK